MAKKAELLEQAQSLGLEVSEENTVAEILSAIKTTKTAEKPQETEVEATILEFTGKPNGKVELYVEVGGKCKHIEVEGKYEDFKVGQKI